jgi:hypothetical protein
LRSHLWKVSAHFRKISVLRSHLWKVSAHFRKILTSVLKMKLK